MSRAPLKPVVPSGVNQSGNSLRGSFGAAIHTADGRRRLKEESGNNEKIITTATTADLPSYVPTCLDELLERSTTQPPPSHYPQHYIQPHHQPQQLTDSSIQEGFGVGEGSLGLDASGGEDVVDNLQQEITLLQHALINRFRGSHKTVGGGFCQDNCEIYIFFCVLLHITLINKSIVVGFFFEFFFFFLKRSRYTDTSLIMR